MIQLQDITKSFGSLQVLRGISLEVARGEVVSIVGPSGAGKTTLLQIMGTLDRPDTGTVLIDGTPVQRMKERELSAFRNRHIGFVFQFHQLLPEFTALENVMIPALIAGRGTQEARKDATDMLALLGLTERAAHKPNELSGGEKQRVAVARALINHPSVVLADEPSGSLDTRHKEELHQLFFDLRRELGQTFVIVTHDEGLAMDMLDEQLFQKCIVHRSPRFLHFIAQHTNISIGMNLHHNIVRILPTDLIIGPLVANNSGVFDHFVARRNSFLQQEFPRCTLSTFGQYGAIFFDHGSYRLFQHAGQVRVCHSQCFLPCRRFGVGTSHGPSPQDSI